MIIVRIPSILMVLIGVIFLFFSFLQAMNILENISDQFRRKWLIILYLMGFFILGYLFFDIILISNLPFPVELVTGGVFLGGAVFVYIIMHISKSTIAVQKKVEDALRESENRYHELSIIDDLTQLYNSRHFYAQLEREIERSNRYEHPLTLLLLDIDKFKAFNDAYGHVEGDNVLSRLGQVIKRCLRETDSAYRYGGEEFTIMLPMTSSEEGIVTAKRIQKELRKEAFSPVLGQKVYMTVSIGLAQYKPKEEMKIFVQQVDQLMYHAKQNGRDRICL